MLHASSKTGRLPCCKGNSEFSETSLGVSVQWGLDLIGGAPCNSTKNGVLEPTINKVKLIQFATEAALTILRIDDMIKVEADPAEEEQ